MQLLSKLHAKMGDLWWYSLMIFVACRSGDVIQAFIGLWLVPKYVGPSELGAVLPLQQLTSFLTVPLAIVALVFSKYVNTYATRGEFGKVKSFIRDVFTASFTLFVICIGGAYLAMPFFYERLRVASGSLTILILLCGLITNLGSLVGSAQQGLKLFKTMSLMALLSAPIRLITLLVAMPIRALSGYILGQTTPTATTTALSIFDIHRVLKPYAIDTSWRRDLPKIWRYLWPYALCTIVGSFAGTMIATIYRQRLPEVESAAYYLLTRFSDISNFASAAITAILFPLASEAHEQGKENSKLLWHSILGSVGCCLAIATIFIPVASPLLSLTEVWRPYQPYAYLMPVLTIAIAPGMVSGAISSYELACGRITATIVMVALNVGFAGLLIFLTGCDYFRGILPNSILDTINSWHIARLSTITYLSLTFGICQSIIMILMFQHRFRPST